MIDVLSNYDAFLFPTKGENYGHVIYEALAAGCVPVISDRTPWLDLEENGCGYVVPLEDQDDFIKTIKELAAIKETGALEDMEIKAVEYARAKYYLSTSSSGYINLFY